MKKSKQKKAEDAPAGVSLSQMASTKQKGKRALVLLSVVLVLGGAGYGGYRTYTWYKDRTSTKQPGVNEVTIDGKTYKIDLVATADNTIKGPDPATIDNKAEIIKLESNIAKDPSYQNYVALANVYAYSEPQKALEYYKKAKAALDPKSPDYATMAAGLDSAINSTTGN